MYKIAETFVGAGGAHIGFHKAGFESRYVLDIDESSIETLKYNNPDMLKNAYVEINDILKVDGKEILQKGKLKQGELDLFFGGIVCKGFSLAGERSPNDERNYFYHKQIELASIIKPKLSIIENVKGIIFSKVLSPSTPDNIKKEVDDLWQDLENYKGKKSHLRKIDKLSEEYEDFGLKLKNRKKQLIRDLEEKGYFISVIKDIQKAYNEIGYRVQYEVLNSSWYGSATKRERVIIVAIRNDIPGEFEFPKIRHFEKGRKLPQKNIKADNVIKPYITVKDALEIIDQKYDDPDNIPMSHKAQTIERFKYIPQGKNIVDVMDSVPNHLSVSSFYSRGNTMRLDPNKPSPTLVPGHSNFPVHPFEDRSITVREAAVITGFPKKYKFFGTHTKRCELVGNAVPVHLAEAVGLSAKSFLDNYSQSKT